MVFENIEVVDGSSHKERMLTVATNRKIPVHKFKSASTELLPRPSPKEIKPKLSAGKKPQLKKVYLR